MFCFYGECHACHTYKRGFLIPSQFCVRDLAILKAKHKICSSLNVFKCGTKDRNNLFLIQLHYTNYNSLQ